MASAPQNEFLVISRGQWDPALEREEIQAAIDRFYVWIEEMCAAGKMKRGQRLGDRGRTVTRGAVTDGPFGESKEVIGGYWFIVAADLDDLFEVFGSSDLSELTLITCGGPFDHSVRQYTERIIVRALKI